MTSETQFLQVFWHKILSLNFVQNNGGAFCMRGSGRQGNIPTLRLPVFHGKCANKKQAVSWKGGGKRHCLLYRNP